MASLATPGARCWPRVQSIGFQQTHQKLLQFQERRTGNKTVIPIATLSSGKYASKLKSCDEIPAERGLLKTPVGLLLNGGPKYLHEHCDKRHRELGPIFREYLGLNELVFVADTKMIQTVIANEGKHPLNNVPEAWSLYNQVNNVERGLFFQTGEPWARLRKALNRVLLSEPKRVSRFGQDILRINEDLFNSWQSKCRTIGRGDSEIIVLDDIKAELCKLSIETTGFMLFGSRMCSIMVDPNTEPDPRAEELVRSVTTMFAETSQFQVIPAPIAYKLGLGSWKRFEAASNRMIEIASELASDYISSAKESLNSHPSLIGDLLMLRSLSDEEVSRSVVDLIIAAADTTSNSLQGMLYLLAKHQDIQSKILDEVSPLLELPDCHNAIKDNAHYLKAFIREASRLYPTAPFLARTLDKDVVLGGYVVPAGKPIVLSLYTTSRMDAYFDQPLEFKPERWLRSLQEKEVGCPKRTNPAYASLPFGIGARMCVGRRAAELEMSLFLASFVTKFHSQLLHQEEIPFTLRMILCPSKPVKLKLKHRV